MSTDSPSRLRTALGHAVVVTASFLVPFLVAAIQAPRSNVSLSYRIDTALGPLVLVGLLNLVAANLIGLPNLYRRFRTRVLASIGAPVLAALVATSLLVLVQSEALPRSVFFATPVVLAPIFLLSTVIVHGSAFTKRRPSVVIVGDADEIAAIEEDLATLRRLDVHLVQSERFGSTVPELTELRPDIVVFCKSSRETPAAVEVAEQLHLSGAKVRRLVDFYEEWFGKLPLQELEMTALFTDVAEAHAPIYTRAKRWIDVVAGLALLVPLVVVAPFVWVANRFSSPGPLFFSQERVGLQGATFRIHKLRTMRPAPASAGEWTIDNDPRITRVGAFLRKTHLDELPQSLNILRGELSMVGPRPEQVHYVDQLSATIPFYGLRHAVRPGLTGWAQVRYPYGANERDAIEKLQFELYYIRHQRLSLDLQVLLMTAGNIVTGGGR
jgi:lipopolysaccharide/colanic/teichoic acid biosynthesis glycosyltransferase